MAYKVDGTVGRSLVALLAEEEEALASLGGPRGDVVGNISDLVGLERGDGLQVNRVGTEPEELLGVEEVPRRVLDKEANQSQRRSRRHTWGSWRPGPCARAGPPQRA
jgi:hypothetical protein